MNRNLLIPLRKEYNITLRESQSFFKIIFQINENVWKAAVLFAKIIIQERWKDDNLGRAGGYIKWKIYLFSSLWD